MVTYNTDVVGKINGDVLTTECAYKLLMCLERLTKRQHEFKLVPSHFNNSEMSTDCRVMSVIFSVSTYNYINLLLTCHSIRDECV